MKSIKAWENVLRAFEPRRQEEQKETLRFKRERYDNTKRRGSNKDFQQDRKYHLN